ncbi:uncharacterized protein DS421_4g131180 [Arachis hypogaea]|nr:uncharacterized protein DS421_4g131180 [Arachis hypogaea]
MNFHFLSNHDTMDHDGLIHSYFGSVASRNDRALDELQPSSSHKLKVRFSQLNWLASRVSFPLSSFHTYVYEDLVQLLIKVNTSSVGACVFLHHWQVERQPYIFRTEI